jgi:ectoine hydroxylase-related dioxygenase (phytanoyl-CoA dioxygenase family)
MNAMCCAESSFQNPADVSWREALDLDGFAVVAEKLSPVELGRLLVELERSSLRGSRAGIRHALRDPAIARLAWEPRLIKCAREVLGGDAVPFSATVFDKSRAANWLVRWHQDRALPVRGRREAPGWSAWSVKDGIPYANAPADILSKILALRVHLDDSTDKNGPLRVLPGTHRLGVLGGDEIRGLAAERSAVQCVVAKGGILAMRPLVVHASSKLQGDIPRRVIHIEYSVRGSFDCFLDTAIA